MKKLDYHVIASGSSGNAVRIENIMIDCGIPFKRMKDDLYKVDTLLITHGHSDHLKKTTYKAIREQFPRVHTYANSDVAYRVDIDTVIGTAPVTLKRRRKMIPFNGVHNVPVTGFILQLRGLNVLYMTDTAKVILPEFCKDLPLDYVFLESNYDEKKIAEMSKQYARKGYDPYNSVYRHLSTQECKKFYWTHRRSKNSVLVELHQSKRFY